MRREGRKMKVSFRSASWSLLPLSLDELGRRENAGRCLNEMSERSYRVSLQLKRLKERARPPDHAVKTSFIMPRGSQ